MHDDARESTDMHVCNLKVIRAVQPPDPYMRMNAHVD